MEHKRVTLSVQSDGRSTGELLRDLEMRRDCRIGPCAREILARSRDRPAPAGTIHQLAVITGAEIGPRWRRTTEHILREARRRGFAAPSPDFALLLRAQFPQDILGYRRLVVFHKPLRDREHHPLLLGLCRESIRGVETDLLVGWEAYPFTMWRRDEAFVFITSAEESTALPQEAFRRRMGNPLTALGTCIAAGA